ncbi:MAG: integrin alpha [Planctomycetota bacterium]
MTIPVQVPRTFEDWTRDGRPDVLVGASQIGTGAGYAEVLEGTTGKRAFPRPPFVGKAKGDAFGHHVAYVGDVNGDGVGDVSIGAPARAAGRGSASVYSRDRLRLATDLHRLSVKQGGTQTLTLAAGKQQANKLYLLVGSLSGTKPGIPLGNNVHLPLNLDSYMRLTLGAPNSAMLSNSLGRLDASGNATAKWNVIPALPQPPVQGFLLHHAYVVIDLTRLSFDFASNAVPLRLLR